VEEQWRITFVVMFLGLLIIDLFMASCIMDLKEKVKLNDR